MNQEYLLAIQRLEPIIENWFNKEELFKVLEYPTEGLCINITYRVGDDGHNYHNDSLLYPCIREYLKSQNLPDDRDNLWFPIEGCPHIYMNASEGRSMYNNPKRLHLAVFMLSWLRQHVLVKE